MKKGKLWKESEHVKKVFALVFALLLLLTACGTDAEPAKQTQPEATAPVETVPVETEPEPTMSPEGYFVEEITKDNGTKVTRHRLGSIKGKVIWSRTENPNGTFEEKTNNSEGKLVCEKYSDTDGVIYERHYYSDMAPQKDITYFPDGSSEELHYNWDAIYTNLNIHPGTVVYEKHVTADGQVTEEGWPLPETIYEADGSWWEIEKYEGGNTLKTHYSKDWTVLESIVDDPVNGYTIETEYYESGVTKKDVWTYTNSTQYRCNEFYENGLTKTSFTIYEDGTEIEDQRNEQGYYTYYRRKDQYGEREYFAGENNELVKYVENGTVYEGDAIPENPNDVFKQLQDMAAQVAYNILNGI